MKESELAFKLGLATGMASELVQLYESIYERDGLSKQLEELETLLLSTHAYFFGKEEVARGESDPDPT